MIPIAALLNVDTDHEEKKEGAELEMKVEPVRVLFRRQVSSVCTSSDEMEDDQTHSPEDDDERDNNDLIKFEELARGSPTTTEASSLLGALTLQKLRYATTPTGGTETAAAEPAPSRMYLSIENLTNPMGDEENDNDNNKPLTPGQEARAARRRSTRALFPGATDEDRRAKQRMIVKRCYYKKINTINELRDQVQQLEGVLHSVLEEQEDQQQQSGSASSEAARLDEYVEVVKDKEVLRHENQRLRKLADEYYMKNQGRLRLLLDANRKEMVLFTPAITEE